MALWLDYLAATQMVQGSVLGVSGKQFTLDIKRTYMAEVNTHVVPRKSIENPSLLVQSVSSSNSTKDT